MLREQSLFCYRFETNVLPNIHFSCLLIAQRIKQQTTRNRLSPCFLGTRSGRVFGTGEQILPGSGRGRRGEHYARHLHQELLG